MRRRLLDFLFGARNVVLLPVGLGCAFGDIAHAQNVAPRSWGFVSTRLDSRSSDAVYTGYGYGSAFVVGALLDNRRSGYAEQVIGIGARGSLGETGSQFVVAAVAKATESRYLEFYYLPTIVRGALSVGTTVIAYVPLDRGGFGQLLVTPLSALVHVVGPLTLGASYEFIAEQHSATSQGAGPSLRAAIPGGELGVDLLCGMRNAAGKVRMSFRAFY